MATLLQRPPLAMFDPSLIHRNDEIFNPEPNGLGFFLRCIPLVKMNQRAPSDSVIPGPGFNHSGVTFLTRNPPAGSAGPVCLKRENWIPAFAGMTGSSISSLLTDH